MGERLDRVQEGQLGSQDNIQTVQKDEIAWWESLEVDNKRHRGATSFKRKTSLNTAKNKKYVMD